MREKKTVNSDSTGYQIWRNAEIEVAVCDGGPGSGKRRCTSDALFHLKDDFRVPPNRSPRLRDREESEVTMSWPYLQR
jgi:hypothetical protein